MSLTLYHVTNVDTTRRAPTWRFLKEAIAIDAFFDGDLYGLPVVCFSSTLINGRLPRWSPYPTQGDAGRSHWRVTLTVDPARFRVFLLNEITNDNRRQTHLLFLDCDVTLEANLANVLPHFDHRELSAPHWGGYLPSGRGNEYQGNHWVNVCFLGPFSLPNSNYRWDPVEKRSFGPGKLRPLTYSGDLVEAVVSWIDRRIDEDSELRNVKLPRIFDEISRHAAARRRTEKLLANLPHEYARAMELLAAAPFNVHDASASKITRYLRANKMPKLCNKCLCEFSRRELINHLTNVSVAVFCDSSCAPLTRNPAQDSSHIYSKERLKDERDKLRQQLRQTSDPRVQQLKIVYAVKMSCMIYLH